MSKKYFGTDGIRGLANSGNMTAEIAMKVAQAAAIAMMGLDQSSASESEEDRQTSASLNERSHRRVVIGKDTRVSGYMIEQAMASGFLSMGMDVVFLGPLPTPAVAMQTRSLRADLGVMISASHNPFHDNGIKLFGGDGFKLSDDLEARIEALIEQDLSEYYAEPHKIGVASRLDDASGRYVEFIKSSFPRGMSLEGFRIVVDCANGAAYKVAPQILWELEADVIPMACAPNGMNINYECGATDTRKLEEAVQHYEADLGIALDGDADRLIMVDERGQRVDGDQLMALLAVDAKAQGRLANDTLVATVMSNLGLELYLKERGIKLLRTKVGDRHVVEAMRTNGYSIGGEQSGHMVLTDYATTGDGLLAAVQILSILKASGKQMSDLCHAFEPVPQVLQNVKFDQGCKPLEVQEVVDAIARAEESLSNDGRILVRASGTEPVIRVMIEGHDPEKIKTMANDLCLIIQKNGAA